VRRLWFREIVIEIFLGMRYTFTGCKAELSANIALDPHRINSKKVDKVE
jgi:hypothetical protein